MSDLRQRIIDALFAGGLGDYSPDRADENRLADEVLKAVTGQPTPQGDLEIVAGVRVYVRPDGFELDFRHAGAGTLLLQRDLLVGLARLVKATYMRGHDF